MNVSRIKSWTTSWWFVWVVVGIIVRAILSMITLHPDIFALSLTPAFFSYHGVIDIYRYLGSLTPATSDYARTLGTQDVFIYPPLTYFTLGIFSFLLRPFADANFLNLVAKNLGETVANPGIYRYLLLSKLPYLFFDLGSLYFLVKIGVDAKVKRALFFLWLFNPISLYATYMIGNLDMLPVFFTIAGTYYLSKSKFDLGFLIFGVGAAYKTYPILIALPLIFFFGRKLLDYIKYFALLVGPYIVTSLPYISQAQYRTNVLFNQKDTKFLFMLLPVSGADFVYIFIVGVVLICAAAACHKVHLSDFWVYPLAVLLLFFSVTNYHPQWMLWISPFLILLFVLKKWSYWPVILLIGCFGAIVFFFDASLNIGLFSPVIQSSRHWISLTDILVKHQFDVSQLRSLVRSVFAGISITLILKLLLSCKVNSDHIVN